MPGAPLLHSPSHQASAGIVVGVIHIENCLGLIISNGRVGQRMGKYEVVRVDIDCLPGSEKRHLFRGDISRGRRHHVHVDMIVAMTWADEKQQPARNWLLELRPQRDMEEKMLNWLLYFL